MRSDIRWWISRLRLANPLSSFGRIGQGTTHWAHCSGSSMAQLCRSR
ncbi:hypothetical protein SGRIM128S_09413 [Streptomyces griseomycini]